MILTGRPDLSASSAAWPAIIDGYSSLPPNPPPVSVCTTRTFVVVAEQALERLVHVERTLDRAVDGDAAVFGHGDDAVRLDVDVLLMSGAVRAFDDDVGARERGVDVAFLDVDAS